MNRSSTPSIELIAGGVSGAASIIASYPLDSIKVKMQTAAVTTYASSLTQGRAGHGALDVIRETDSWRRLYRGMMSPVMGAAAVTAIMFFSYSALKEAKWVKREYPNIALSGGLTGVALSLIECPVELTKVRCQVSNAKSGAMQMAKSIFVRDGFRGMYHGLTPTLLRNVPANAVYFLVYESMSKELGCNALVSGGLAGTMYWIACYPTDVVKSLVQAKTGHGTWQCTRELCGLDGGDGNSSNRSLKPLFRGFVPCIARAFIAGAVCFFTYEVVKEWMTPDRKSVRTDKELLQISSNTTL